MKKKMAKEEAEHNDELPDPFFEKSVWARLLTPLQFQFSKNNYTVVSKDTYEANGIYWGNCSCVASCHSSGFSHRSEKGIR
jgi:hypothetical protein